MAVTKLSVVIPLYNEHENIADCYRRLTELMRSYGEGYELIFVDDGSDDDTVSMARVICEHDKRTRLIALSKSFGHDIAVAAGVGASCGEAVLLTHTGVNAPDSAVLSIIERWEEGYELVLGRELRTKQDRVSTAPVKKPLLRFVSKLDEPQVSIPGGGLVLMDRKVVEALEAFPERERYTAGRLSRIGFRSAVVEYLCEAGGTGRIDRESVHKKLWLTAGGMMKFSRKALFIPFAVGSLIALISLVCVVANLVTYSSGGWTPLAISLLFLLNGALFVVVGVAGEYVVRLCDELRGRPLYVVSERIGFDNKN